VCFVILQGSVCEWLSLLRLPDYIGSLERQGYTDIDSITDITWEDLEDIGITKLGRNSIILSLLCFAVCVMHGLYRTCAYRSSNGLNKLMGSMLC